MRVLFVLAMAFLVLPLSGCAKKKEKDESPTTASNDQGDMGQGSGGGMGEGSGYGEGGGSGEGSGSDAGGGLDEEMLDGESPDDYGSSGHGEGDNPSEFSADDYESSADDMNEDMFADAQNEQNFNGGSNPGGGHGDGRTQRNPANYGSSPNDGMPEDLDMPDRAGYDSNPDGGGSDPANPDNFRDGGLGDDGYGQGGYGQGGGGQSRKPPKKASEVRGVKEGTAEYAAVSFILKVAHAETEGLKSLIAEEPSGKLLKSLRADDPKEALAEAKEMIGQVRYKVSRLVDRDTVVTFESNKKQILQFYMRRIQGDYQVREIRVKEAVNRRSSRGRR